MNNGIQRRERAMLISIIVFLLATLAFVSLGRPARADAPERALHVVYVPAGDAQPGPVLRTWLEQRGIAYQVAWLGVAMELSEAELEALAERGDVVLMRAPLPSEPLPERSAVLITSRVWLPALGR